MYTQRRLIRVEIGKFCVFSSLYVVLSNKLLGNFFKESFKRFVKIKIKMFLNIRKIIRATDCKRALPV